MEGVHEELVWHPGHSWPVHYKDCGMVAFGFKLGPKDNILTTSSVSECLMVTGLSDSA